MSGGLNGPTLLCSRSTGESRGLHSESPRRKFFDLSLLMPRLTSPPFEYPMAPENFHQQGDMRMKRRLWCSLALVLLASAAWAQGGGTEQAVAALEQKWLHGQQTNNPDLIAPLGRQDCGHFERRQGCRQSRGVGDGESHEVQ